MAKFLGDIVANSTDVSITVLLRSSSDGSELLGKVAANVTAKYWRQGGVPVVIPVTDLAGLNSSHSDGGWAEAEKGAYRLDLPDGAVAQGSDWVNVIVNTADSRVFHERYNLKTGTLSVEGAAFEGVLDAGYLTPDGADEYFLTKLHVNKWFIKTDLEKSKALIEATRIIDRLNFVGVKTSVFDAEPGADLDVAFAAQVLEFPRGGDTVVPTDIKIACAEIAYKLLVDKVNPDMEMDELKFAAQTFAGVRSTYDRFNTPEHLLAGIPSPTAWRHLRPYVEDVDGVILSRVS